MGQSEIYEQILRRAARTALWHHGPFTEKVNMKRPEIEELIPHREPFLLLDAITAVDYEQQAIEGTRRIDPDDPVFAGHFPLQPIYPGVLLLEMMGQLGLCMMRLAEIKDRQGALVVTNPANVRLIRIHSAVFAAPANPGDELTIRSILQENNGLTYILAGQISRGEIVCTLSCMEVCYA